MSGSLGSLVVEISANVARFQSDMGKVSHLAEQAMARVEKVSGTAATALKGLAAGAVAGFTLGAFKNGIEGAINAAAQLKDLSEKSGASVEALSGLKAAAKLSGTDMEAVAGGAARLSKQMYDAASGSQQAASRFKNLGIAVTDGNGQLRDSGQVMLELAQKLAGMGNGAQAAAEAQHLLGKRGAELLPFMHELAEIGELNAKVTTEMAAEADAYQKNLLKLEARKKALYNTIAQAVLPAMRDFTDALLANGSMAERANGKLKELSTEGTLQKWARNAAGALGFVIDMFDGVVRIVRIAIGALESGADQLVRVAKFFDDVLGDALAGKGFSQVGARWNQMFADITASGTKWKNETQEILMAPLFSDKLKKEFADRDAGLKTLTKPKPPGGGIVPILPSADAKSPFKLFLDELDRMVTKAGESEYAMLRLKAQQIAAKDATANLGEAYNRINALQRSESAKVVDEYTEKLVREREEMGFSISMIGKSARETEDLTASMRARLEVEKMILEAKKRGRPLDDEATTALRAQAEAQVQAMQTLRNQRDAEASAFNTGANKALNDYMAAARNQAAFAEKLINGSLQRIEDSLLNFVKTGKLNFKDLFAFMAEEFLRQQIRMQFASVISQAGSAGGGFNFGSLLGTVGGWFGFPHAGGLEYVPYDGYPAVLHKGERVQTAIEARQGGGGQGQHFDFSGQQFHIGAGVSRAEVMAAVNQGNAQVEMRIRRLSQQGGLS